ncbi:hypothetical protein EMIHUDRAFT_208785 [Emiliania huxleyi CCMP1516]|uniref:Uncharacterized protein n=2 Tax=Emiliania huxleyi TaxID=2903 RepID=A0A0D3J935_EMIH1|nr:hypothetical protein EMIHUDRAFT_246116 [Emiliania huxleyi CCMP1516]XP_005772449.1 hypothetical protein EMIHUDRAFT_208785 [Emiliania huxleyi CCMP1516]EOD15096.1 hypothetical protein EMIHUDRAFT_246116 [Emiliania huxleyi CCMP1516]EOD20020.1 hypothetical protein EMIHUDRAFT_208785 [Emiliania huxleyi CCMP1516]|mmetsp:Transcript_27139/g.80848  ORF Transcript_27139/g.80848 Transcript_27139/m.80848 type:complete len:92 (-) Transcript_27139:213-488(-)|eukprot:XP_005767525.1 hypothetical protein EMIHUDRAFT_246116 [Emiliania huxleyi CCMP1516]
MNEDEKLAAARARIFGTRQYRLAPALTFAFLSCYMWYVYYVERPNNERLAASNPELYALLNPAQPPPGVVSVHEASGRQLMADGSIRRPDR